MILPWRVPGLLKRALLTGLPISLANFVVAASSLAELFIVARHLGSYAIGGVSLAANLCLVMILAFYSLQIAVQAVVSRRHGARDYAAAGQCMNAALLIGFGGGALAFATLQFLGPQVFSAAVDNNVREAAFTYFRWRLPSIPLIIPILAMVGFFNGIGRPRITLYVYAPVLVVHLVLVYLFTGGLGPAHNLGVRGAGLASTISTGLGLGLFLWNLARPALRHQYGLLAFNLVALREASRGILRLASPMFLQQVLGNLSIYLFQLIAARIEDAAATLVATTIALLFINLSTLPGLGFGTAAATLAGQALGARKPALADASVRLCWVIGASWMVLLGVVYALFGESIASQFLLRAGDTRVSAEHHDLVLENARIFFIIVGATQLFESFNTILGKALQGLGLTRFVLIRTSLSQWVFFLPMAYLLALPMGWGGTGAWLAMAGYLVINSATFLHRFLSGKWKSHEV